MRGLNQPFSLIKELLLIWLRWLHGDYFKILIIIGVLVSMETHQECVGEGGAGMLSVITLIINGLFQNGEWNILDAAVFYHLLDIISVTKV